MNELLNFIRNRPAITVAALLLIFVIGLVFLSRPDEPEIPSGKADFSPSPGTTLSGEYLAAGPLNSSARCGESSCHPDIYAQWELSAHRNSSFNNPFYKAAVEYLLASADTAAVRWCGSCHDPVMLYSGRMRSGIDMDQSEASAGVTCEVCHAIVDVRDITGNGNYVLDAPKEAPFARSRGIGKLINGMIIRVNPSPHREAFMKPIHKDEKFCTTCHKVSLDVPINHYRWLRGQDEYGAWQASGVSHNAVASFYRPPVPLECTSCHMFDVASNDKGNDDGKVNSHWFPGANTALPMLPTMASREWVDRTSEYLKRNRVSVDIFGIHVDDKLVSALGDKLRVRPGQQIRFEVVVRTLNIGHFFPGGTIDSNEAWLQAVGRNSRGETVFSSGAMEPDKTVDPAAHFFRGVLLDGNGQFILKRNPHEWRTTLYNNTIPPGAADVIHYTWTVPWDFNEDLTLTVRLNYRKFNRDLTLHSLETPVDLPIVEMATDEIILTVFDDTDFDPAGGMRHNDYGIGMFRQNNLGQALEAFEKVTELLPDYGDGYINSARVLIEEGEFVQARERLNRALMLEPGYPKANYFLGVIAKMEGDFEKAIDLFSSVRETNPRDRQLLKNLGQAHYFSENWEQARSAYEAALEIDPEDDDTHYNLMLINRNLGNMDRSRAHSKKYLKYKPDEVARSISQSARLNFPHANNEAQPVHSHPLTSPLRTAAKD